MNVRVSILALLASLLGGCATQSSLPQSPSEVNLQAGRFEQGYWPRYSASTSLPGESLERVYQAAKGALLANEFALVRDEKERGVVMGEHRATLFYWNVMAGVYFTQEPNRIVVKVVTVGSKDVGFIELVPSDWPSKIVSSIESALRNRAR